MDNCNLLLWKEQCHFLSDYNESSSLFFIHITSIQCCWTLFNELSNHWPDCLCIFHTYWKSGTISSMWGHKYLLFLLLTLRVEEFGGLWLYLFDYSFRINFNLFLIFWCWLSSPGPLKLCKASCIPSLHGTL